MISFEEFQSDYNRFIKETEILNYKYIKTINKDYVLKQYYFVIRFLIIILKNIQLYINILTLKIMII